jgi:hypothetical protein
MIDEIDETKHCDSYVDNPRGNSAARWFIFVNRLPASLRILAQPYIKDPKLFADYQGKRVRVVMASRLGNLGITYDLTADYGYKRRVLVDELTNFSGEA